MKIITPFLLAQDVPNLWRQRYGTGWETDSNKQEITRQLDALEKLGLPIQPETVEAIIGNRSWTRIYKCDECGTEEPPLVVQLGEGPDYESSTANVCLRCLEVAVTLARSQS